MENINTINLEDRRFIAQCTQNLSASGLSALLDLLFLHFPNEVVERKGGESYHIDVGTLSPEAFVVMRQFVKQALRDDDDMTDLTRQETLPYLMIPEALRQNSLSSLPMRQNSIDSISDFKISSSREFDLGSPRGFSQKSLADSESNEQNPPNQQKGSLPTVAEATPILPLPAKDNHNSDVTSIHVPSEKTSRFKRHRESDSSESIQSSDSKKTKPGNESRYYNGERVWRKDDNQILEFNGVRVKLLSIADPSNRPWVCEVCGKAFVSKDKIVNHVQQHSGEKVHECQICHNRFSSKHYLKEHERRVHQFDCQHCSKIFDTFEKLHEHAVRMHPGDELTKCSCHKGCANSRCSCFKNGLNCNDSCQCSNCNNRVADNPTTASFQQLTRKSAANFV